MEILIFQIKSIDKSWGGGYKICMGGISKIISHWKEVNEYMKKMISILMTISLILVLATPSFAYNKESPPSVTNTYFTASASKINTNVIKTNGREIKRQYKYLPVIKLEIPSLSYNKKIACIEKDAIANINSQGIP